VDAFGLAKRRDGVVKGILQHCVQHFS